ncbi:hypothetical protein [Dyadobacter tibetensis]|uniref:hypothetical protein n=1 Tax=Dyadobacter tibetensis TaxID=1211851 RepID=UPI00046EEF57|nr:hypothetical protein [Dyadobacter tibetensis]
MSALLNELYSIENLSETDTMLKARVRINADHPIFSGHFPGNPITPGVIQMEMVKAVMQEKLGRRLTMKSMKTCKFLQIINPEATPLIDLEIVYNDVELLEVAATGVFGETVYFKMQSAYC